MRLDVSTLDEHDELQLSDRTSNKTIAASLISKISNVLEDSSSSADLQVRKGVSPPLERYGEIGLQLLHAQGLDLLFSHSLYRAHFLISLSTYNS